MVNLYTLPFSLQEIFRPPLDEYDVIINVHRHLIPRRHEALDCHKPRTAPTSHHHDSEMPVVDFDPVQCYITELKVSWKLRVFLCSVICKKVYITNSQYSD